MKTNNIEKMRQEFENKIKFAEMENEQNERVNWDFGTLRIVGESITQPGKIHAYIRRNDWKEGLTATEAARVLNDFPQTERSRVYIGGNKYDSLSYIMETEKTPGRADLLKISYISGEYDLSFDVVINPSDADLMQFFTVTRRELSDTEINLYLGGKRTKWNYNTRHYFPYYTFNLGQVVKFQGGRDRQINEGAAITIASNLWCRTED